MGKGKQHFLPAKEVMDLVNSKTKKVYAYITLHKYPIKSAEIISHTGYIRFHVWGTEIGQNTMSAHPDTKIEVYFYDDK